MANKTAQKLCLLGAAVLLFCILLKSWDSGAAAVDQSNAKIRCNADAAPSVLYGDGRQIKMWWSGNTKSSDGIYYAARQDAPAKVLATSDAGWDSSRICNPSVIKGSFYTNGQAYTYAMYYTGTAEPDGSSQIGVAFSNDGIRWDKCAANPIISSCEPAPDSFGVGMPSACISANGQVSILYFDSATETTYTAISPDGINFTDKTPLKNFPADAFCTDIAYSPTEGKWYIIAQSSTSLKIHIYESADNKLTNDWTLKAALPQTASEREENQSPKWMRYPGGSIYKEKGSGYQYIYHGSGQNSVRSAYTASWEFSTSGDRQGWEAVNITKDTGPVEGFWTFITNQDNPYLSSPAVELPASSYATVTVRIANQNSGADGKIYFKTAEEDFYSEDKAVAFTCTAGGGWYTHYICMSANKKWTGTITGIRVDPVSAGTVAACGIDFIRVVE